MADGRRRVHIHPENVRFTKKTVSAYFDVDNGVTIRDTAQKIRAGTKSHTDFARIKVIEHRGLMWALDNRRLLVCRLGGVEQVEVDVVKLNDSRISDHSATRLYRLQREFEKSPDVFSAMSSKDYYPTFQDPTTRPARQLLDMGGDQVIPTVKEPEPEPEPELKRESKLEPESEPETSPSQTEAQPVGVPLPALCPLPSATPELQSEAGSINSLEDRTSALEEERRGFRCGSWIAVAALAIGIPAASALFSFVRGSGNL